MTIKLEDAKQIVERGEEKARDLNIPVIIAVLDESANLKAFTRMDGAVLGSIDIALKKARTAALFGCNSEDVWEYCKPGAPAHALELTNGGLAPFAGGVLLRGPAGEAIGAVGVSGGAVSQDLEIAQAAAGLLTKASNQ
ncbi:MAG TPA: heme-binding protein [Pyrinomonadaceae bacterium]|nr:heme-binding protein [Pyrinomonadaceae bacterium]